MILNKTNTKTVTNKVIQGKFEQKKFEFDKQKLKKYTLISLNVLKYLAHLVLILTLVRGIIFAYQPVVQVYPVAGTLLDFLTYEPVQASAGNILNEILMKANVFIYQNTHLFLFGPLFLIYILFLTRKSNFFKKIKIQDVSIRTYIQLLTFAILSIPTLNFLRLYFFQDELIYLLNILKEVIPFI